jgi:hypothetical protein
LATILYFPTTRRFEIQQEHHAAGAAREQRHGELRTGLLEGVVHDAGLGLAERRHYDTIRRFQRGQRERQASRRRLRGIGDGGDPACLLLEQWVVGKERSDMAVRPDAEQQEVESGRASQQPNHGVGIARRRPVEVG